VSEYEFSNDENRVVGTLATVSRISGWLNLVLAAGMIVVCIKIVSAASLVSGGGALTAVIVMFSAALLALFGVWLIRAASLLGNIVTTQGSDITHLMAAFRELAKIYRTQFWMWMVGIVLIGVAIVFRVGYHLVHR
jgi:hypothetical protein